MLKMQGHCERRPWSSVFLLISLAVQGVAAAAPTELLLPSGTTVADWPSVGRDYREQHYSPLDQISTQNVQHLSLAWYLDLAGEHTLEATPIAVGGIIYFSGQNASVYAVAAKTGALLWKYDPESWKAESGHERYIFSVNRGVAYANGKVFVGTTDGRLIAVNAKTGKEEWTVRTFPLGTKKYIVGAPRVFKDKVIVGNGGADYGERGYVTAYEISSGRQAWRFYTAPGKPSENVGDPAMERAAKTWAGSYWNTGTGGTVWGGMTFDTELNQLYIGTGNSGPYNPAQRSPGHGDNLYLVSIVALNPDTGKYIWHYQMNPREAWDYKATADIELTDMTIDGKKHKVLMQAPTNGFFYILDRVTGHVLSAEKLGKVTWAERIDLKSGRPVEAANIRYENGETIMWPGPYGAHNWQPMSFSPSTGLVYIPYMQVGGRYSVDPHSTLGGVGISFVLQDEDDGKGKLIAWDPATQKSRWSISIESMWNGGVASTAGNLVFQGVEDGSFNAYDARSGTKVWSFDAQLGIVGAPITYLAEGKQYVSILVGYGGATGIGSGFIRGGWKYGAQTRRLLTFALDGKASLPAAQPRNFAVNAVDDPKLVIDESAVQMGAGLYASKNCIVCHGTALRSAGSPAPDLRESSSALSEEGLKLVLHEGVLAKNGMPQFSELSDSEIRNIYMYIRAGSREALGKRSPPADGKSTHM